MKNYRSGDHKAGEEIPCRVKDTGNYGGNLVVRTYSYDHHSIIYVVQNCDEHEEHVLEELSGCPFIVNHRINYNPINKNLSQYIWDLNCNLKK